MIKKTRTSNYHKSWCWYLFFGKILVEPQCWLCIHLFAKKKNNGECKSLPLGVMLCFRIVVGYAEIFSVFLYSTNNIIYAFLLLASFLITRQHLFPLPQKLTYFSEWIKKQFSVLVHVQIQTKTFTQ